MAIKSGASRSAAVMSAAHDAGLIDELLVQVNLRARIAFRGLVCERWAIGGSSQGRLGFHAVLSGNCWLRVPDVATPVELTAGGLLIYRPDTRHLLADTVFADRETSPTRILPISTTVVGPQVGLLCGYFESGETDIPVVDAVPAYLLWRNFAEFPEPLARLMLTLAACAPDESRGGEQILQRLCELLLLMILREPSVLRSEGIGILRAKRDPVLRRVFEAIQARPNRHWTLAALAHRAGLSRSAFAARFKEQAEMPAMQYLRRYRVARAERRMREEGLSVNEAARAIGYRSASAFRRAARRR
jgi:AraC-like DNA-binding protein